MDRWLKTEVYSWYDGQVTEVYSWYDGQVTEVYSWYCGQVTEVYSWYDGQVTEVYRWYDGQVTEVYCWYDGQVVMAKIESQDLLLSVFASQQTGEGVRLTNCIAHVLKLNGTVSWGQHCPRPQAE